MAFVQLASATDLQAALRLHHIILSGRRINVERSCGGGVEKKREKLGALRQNLRPPPLVALLLARAARAEMVFR